MCIISYVSFCEHIGTLTGGTTRDDGLVQTFFTFALLLPGNVLNLTNQRKFHLKGNKNGAKLGWDLLQHCGLGELKEKKARCGTDMVEHTYVYWLHLWGCEGHPKWCHATCTFSFSSHKQR